MENAHEDITDLQCNRTNERKPAMRVENMPNPRTRLKSVSDASHESGMSAVK